MNIYKARSARGYAEEIAELLDEIINNQLSIDYYKKLMIEYPNIDFTPTIEICEDNIRRDKEAVEKCKKGLDRMLQECYN